MNLSRTNENGNRNTTVKPQNTKDKKKIIKAAREKREITYKEITTGLISVIKKTVKAR